MRGRGLRGAILAILGSVSMSASAAFLRDVPVEVRQPDGSVIQLLATGDEFYHWVHDEKGFVVIQDPETGWAVYATRQDGALIPTSLVAGRSSPRDAGLEPGLRPDPDKVPASPIPALPTAPRPAPRESGEVVEDAPPFTTLNNLVVFIRFSDEAEYTTATSTYDAAFNAAAPTASMKSYFLEVSYGQTTISSTFYPAPPGSTVVSYQSPNPRSFYQPYSATTNPGGYDPAAPDSSPTSRTYREHHLLADAVAAIASSVPAGLVIDSNGDGAVDNVCFVVRGSAGAWSSLLWPHRWSLYSLTANINGKRVYTYNFQLENSFGVSVLCHEMFHSLGSPDLYHYSQDGLAPVGTWDLMEANTSPPQHMGAYMKWRYGKWIASLSVASGPGPYTLNVLTSSTNNALKVASPNSTTEWFVLEYRRKTATGMFESKLPGSGLLVYRIDTARDGVGNRNGPPDEVYIYRPGGSITTNGSPSSAALGAGTGRTSFGAMTDPDPWLNSGVPGGLEVYNVVESGDTVSFNVNVLACGGVPGAFSPLSPGDGALVTDGTATIQWTPSSGATSYDVYFGTTNPPPLYANQAGTFRTVAVAAGTQYYWKVIARTAGLCAAAARATPLSFTTGPAVAAIARNVPVGAAGATGSWSYWSFTVPPGATNLVVSTSGGTGDVDLYLRAGGLPSSALYDCRPYADGNAETCTVPAPQPGPWYVGLNAYSAYSGVTLSVTWSTPTGAGFYSLPPCRVVNTRNVSGPSLDATTSRLFVVTGGTCGVPATAKAVVLNVTVAEPTAAGYVTAYPGWGGRPAVSTLNFALGQVKANNAIVPLGTNGALGLFNGSAGTVNVLVDVSGYFQ